MRVSPSTLAVPLFAMCVGATMVPVVRADDWPQYRGPDRSGVSRETGLLKTWPKDGPPLLWAYRDAGVGFTPPHRHQVKETLAYEKREVLPTMAVR